MYEELEELGVNVKEGLERVIDDKPLYETMLGMFVDRVNSNPIGIEDFNAEDAESLEELTKQVHTLKGLTGNLAMTPLFDGYMQMLDLLRTDCAKDAKKVYERIFPVQNAILECLERYISSE